MRKQIFSPGQPVLDGNGNPLAGGKIHIYVPGTTTNSTSFSNSALTAANPNPVLIDSSGRVNVWIDRDVDVRVVDVDDVLVYTESSVNPFVNIAFDGGVIANGSFEVQDAADATIPEGWTRQNELSGSSNEFGFTSNVASGTRSWCFTSTGSGGGELISDVFSLIPGEKLFLTFFLKKTAAALTAEVDVAFYDSAESLLSTATIYSDSATAISSFNQFALSVDIPASTAFGRVIIKGAVSPGTGSGSVYFDGIRAGYGTYTVPAQELVHPLSTAGTLALKANNIDRHFTCIVAGTFDLDLDTEANAGYVRGQFFKVSVQGSATFTVDWPAGVTVNSTAGASNVTVTTGTTRIFVYNGNNLWLERTI